MKGRWMHVRGKLAVLVGRSRAEVGWIRTLGRLLTSDLKTDPQDLVNRARASGVVDSVVFLSLAEADEAGESAGWRMFRTPHG
jgi:hypothetical protein